MSLDAVIRCLGVNFLLMGYLVCATLIHIAINSSKIQKQLEKMDKDKQKEVCEMEMTDREITECIVKMRYGMEIGYGQEIVRCKNCKFRQSKVFRIIDGRECNYCEMVKGYKPEDWFCADGKRR